MSKRSLKFLFIPFLLAIFVAATVFFVKNKPLVVNVVSVKEKVAIEVYGLGTIEARIVSSVGFEVGATLIELNVDQGDKIEKGAVLARLHSTEQEAKTAIAAAAVEAAKAKLEKAQAALPKLESTLDFYKISNKRSKALLPRGSIGEEEAEQHVDKQQRADFQKPKAEHADRRFQKEPEEETHQQRGDERRHGGERRDEDREA